MSSQASPTSTIRCLPALCNRVSCLIAPPLTRGGSDRITFQSLTKCREFTYVLIIFSKARLTNVLIVENDVISETSCMSELSSIQLVSVCHCINLILNEIQCDDISKAYRIVPLSYSRSRGPHPNGEGPVSIFSIASSSALVSSLVVVAAHVWLMR